MAVLFHQHMKMERVTMRKMMNEVKISSMWTVMVVLHCFSVARVFSQTATSAISSGMRGMDVRVGCPLHPVVQLNVLEEHDWVLWPHGNDAWDGLGDVLWCHHCMGVGLGRAFRAKFDQCSRSGIETPRAAIHAHDLSLV
jgi:hypothetical protein